ncbi:MAG: leucine-rich repeat domain-containing protein [Candidatus Paceibacterota bacterium]|jgi:hypothetical protein
MDITAARPIASSSSTDDDDTVLASLWEAWKISFQESQGWTSMDQWMASPGRIIRDSLPPHRVITLDAENCRLTSLPREIGRLSSLQGLYLEGNRLTSLPPEIGQLSSLQELGLSDNQLTSLPPEMGQLSSLQWLALGRNQLTSLPPQIGQLSSLKTLYLSHNQLTSLPLEMGHLTSLQELAIIHNQLTSLPIEMANLSSLIWLFLNDNCLVYLPSMPLKLNYGGREDQRLPTVLDATTFPLLKDSDASVDMNMDMVADDTPSEFSLYFYSDESPHQQLSSPVPALVANRHSLAKRWPYFRYLLDAGLSEAQEGGADLSAYFSLRLGRCLIDYFEGKSVHVSSLSTQDCRDLVAHADYFGLTDTLLFHFCTTKLKTK